MTESVAWGSLRDAIMKAAAELKSSIHMVRIENMVGAGVFDTNACFNGHEFWLEGKFADYLPVRDMTLFKSGMSIDQEAFALRRLLAGGKTYLWVRVAHNRRVGDSGWYLAVLDSIGVIERMRRGITLAEFKTFYHSSARDLALSLLRSLL